jgi:hypothetical protein
MAEPDKRPVTMEELLVSSLAQTDALAKLLIEKGLITGQAIFFHVGFTVGADRESFWLPHSVYKVTCSLPFGTAAKAGMS